MCERERVRENNVEIENNRFCFFFRISKSLRLKRSLSEFDNSSSFVANLTDAITRENKSMKRSGRKFCDNNDGV